MLDSHRPHMMPMANALNNVVYRAQASDVWLNMVDGKVLYRAGNYCTLDLDRVLSQALLCAARIVEDGPES